MHNGINGSISWGINHQWSPAYPQVQSYQLPPAYSQQVQSYQSLPGYPWQHYQSPSAYPQSPQHSPNGVYNYLGYRPPYPQPDFRSPTAASSNISPQRAGQGISANPGTVLSYLVPKVINKTSPSKGAITPGIVSRHKEIFEPHQSKAPESNKNVPKDYKVLTTAENMTQRAKDLSNQVKSLIHIPKAAISSLTRIKDVSPEASKKGSVSGASPSNSFWSESIIEGRNYSGHSSPSVGQDGGQSNSPRSPNSYLLHASGVVGSNRASTPNSSSTISKFLVDQGTQTDLGVNNKDLLERVTRIEDFHREVVDEQKAIIDKQKAIIDKQNTEILGLKNKILAIRSSFNGELYLSPTPTPTPSPSRSPTPCPIGDLVESSRQPKR